MQCIESRAGNKNLCFLDKNADNNQQREVAVWLNSNRRIKIGKKQLWEGSEIQMENSKVLAIIIIVIVMVYLEVEVEIDLFSCKKIKKYSYRMKILLKSRVESNNSNKVPRTF